MESLKTFAALAGIICGPVLVGFIVGPGVLGLVSMEWEVMIGLVGPVFFGLGLCGAIDAMTGGMQVLLRQHRR